ncbi:MAG: ATP-binding cassette domain-containing protein [Fibrobacterota bacterium]
MIEFLNVTKTYQANWPVLDGIRLTVGRGEFVFLTGRSGSGKTTLLYHIILKERPTEGKVIVDGVDSSLAEKRDVAALRRRIGMIFQEFYLLNDRSVFENIALPLRFASLSQSDVKKRAFKALAYTGLSHKMNETPRYLSSGEKQRICIARALVNDPIVLLADEPTGNLDAENAADILSLLRNIHLQGTAVILATHNAGLLAQLPARQVHLENGRIV